MRRGTVFQILDVSVGITVTRRDSREVLYIHNFFGIPAKYYAIVIIRKEKYSPLFS